MSNESADIVRMLGAMAGALEGTTAVDLYPKHLRSLIDETNTWVYQARHALHPPHANQHVCCDDR